MLYVFIDVFTITGVIGIATRHFHRVSLKRVMLNLSILYWKLKEPLSSYRATVL